MLFNSYIFIFAFLPVVLIGFHLIGKRGHHRVAISWLVAASLFFYGWWNPAYLGLILGSILFNFAVGAHLGGTSSKPALVFGITVNLCLIAYFKYANFFVENLNSISGSDINLEKIILPLAISFFTFQQITYLVDAYRGLTKEYNFLHYCLFVLFFPQLIAGPIVHHREMLPQFSSDSIYKIRSSCLAIGITIFISGLFKKVVLADSIALYATPIFGAAELGVNLTFFEAWGGALAYTFQLYFDFSGYSDMAIGIARMFGIILPINFYSPYKANSIIEFWRRWHITLSRFLRDYVYIPLGGNRKGQASRYINLFATMLIGGLWHGAGWTFIIWGGMHGAYLAINHVWISISNKLFPWNNRFIVIKSILGRLITFSAVVIAWVMFRAESVSGALGMYSAMFDLNHISLQGMFANEIFGDPKRGVAILLVMLIIVWSAPNTLNWMRNYDPALHLNNFITQPDSSINWKPTTIWALVIVGITITSLFFMLGSVSEFLYFQF